MQVETLRNPTLVFLAKASSERCSSSPAASFTILASVLRSSRDVRKSSRVVLFPFGGVYAPGIWGTYVNGSRAVAPAASRAKRNLARIFGKLYTCKDNRRSKSHCNASVCGRVSRRMQIARINPAHQREKTLSFCIFQGKDRIMLGQDDHAAPQATSTAHPKFHRPPGYVAALFPGTPAYNISPTITSGRRGLDHRSFGRRRRAAD